MQDDDDDVTRERANKTKKFLFIHTLIRLYFSLSSQQHAHQALVYMYTLSSVGRERENKRESCVSRCLNCHFAFDVSHIVQCNCPKQRFVPHSVEFLAVFVNDNSVHCEWFTITKKMFEENFLPKFRLIKKMIRFF